MQKNERRLSDIFTPATKHLERLVEQLNNAVMDAQKEKMTEHMASTMVAFYFAGRHIYSCNVGDSRSFCLRYGELRQMWIDHVESRPVRGHSKAALTQYLGINTEEMLLVISKVSLTGLLLQQVNRLMSNLKMLNLID
jgi:serine/threonine protein phosphatase PrpC